MQNAITNSKNYRASSYLEPDETSYEKRVFQKTYFVNWFELAVLNLEAAVHDLELDAFLLRIPHVATAGCLRSRFMAIRRLGIGIIFKIYDF
jgi:hypothetical protein